MIRKWFIRTAIIFFWVIIILGSLYFPSVITFPFEKKSINVFTWAGTLDSEVFSQFEQETGIKIHLNFYTSNEELLVKLKATGGEGYDLIMPSDYAVALLTQENLLKPIDRSKLNFWNDLNPLLLNHRFDPENRYSIPFEWEVFGLGIDPNYFKGKPFSPSWKLIFDANMIDYKIAMNNDPIEAVLFSTFYLYGKTDNVTETEFQGVRKLLLQQRTWVEAYAEFRADYFLATGNCPVALTTSALIWHVRQMYPFIDFVVPEEGSFLTIENFCIPVKSKKEKYLYQFLNYLYTIESAKINYNNLGLFPAILSVFDQLELEDYEKRILQYSREDFKKLHFIKNIYPQKKVRDLWVEVKSF